MPDREVEVKLAAASAEEARAALEAAGFVAEGKRQFEGNNVYDTADSALRRRQCLLRLREYGGESIVTFKGPQEEGPHRIRPEHETKVADAVQFERILSGLGYRIVFRYEKYRTVFTRPGDSGHVLLDETPIGVWIELEGDGDWIDRTAAELGYTAADYVLESYGALYLSHCRTAGIQPGHMVFEDD